MLNATLTMSRELLVMFRLMFQARYYLGAYMYGVKAVKSFIPD